jgi:hypothetical protein
LISAIGPTAARLAPAIDEPVQAQYSYQSDGTSFVARAVEDPSCEGNTLTFEAIGRVVDGQPVVTVSQLQ